VEEEELHPTINRREKTIVYRENATRKERRNLLPPLTPR